MKELLKKWEKFEVLWCFKPHLVLFVMCTIILSLILMLGVPFEVIRGKVTVYENKSSIKVNNIPNCTDTPK